MERKDRQLVIMCPGLSGDNQKLADFRANFTGYFRFFVPGYPNWDEIVRGRASLKLFIDRAVSDITAELDEQPVALLGYSFGGLIAHEIAGRLTELGYHVAVVGILDLDITFGPTPPAQQNLLRRSRSGALWRDIKKHGPRQAIGRRFAYRLAIRVFRSPNICRLFAHISHRIFLPRAIAEPFDHLMRLRVHEAVARAWLPRSQPVSTVVFRSRAQMATTIPLDLGWGRYAPVVKVAEVGGTHHSMISGLHGKRLAHRIKSEFDSFLGNRGGDLQHEVAAYIPTMR